MQYLQLLHYCCFPGMLIIRVFQRKSAKKSKLNHV